MAAWQAVLSLIEVLKTIPVSLVPAGHVGVRRPTRRADLPTIVVSMGEVVESPIGIGSWVGAGQVAPGQWVEATGSKAAGVIVVEVWTTEAQGVTPVADALFAALSAGQAALRGAGFVKFGNRAIKPVESATVANQAALMMGIDYAVTYEEVNAATTGPGGIIQRVQVEVAGEFDEQMDIP